MPIHDWQRVDAGVFHDFHIAWIASLSQALNQGILPADYYALAEQRRDTVSAEGPAQPLYGHGLMPGAELSRHSFGKESLVFLCPLILLEAECHRAQRPALLCGQSRQRR